jgi:hypothetical protein
VAAPTPEGGSPLAPPDAGLDATAPASPRAAPAGAAAPEPGARPADAIPCYDFTKGMCTRGDKCKYSHDIATIVHFNSREKGICFDYLRNQCHRGLLCRFSHDLSNIAQQCQVGGGGERAPQRAALLPQCSSEGLTCRRPPFPRCQVYNGAAGPGAAAAPGAPGAPPPGPQRRATSICYDFVKGVCSRGVECRYSHDLSLIARTARGGAGAGGGAGGQPTDVCYDYLRWAGVGGGVGGVAVGAGRDAAAGCCGSLPRAC